jgi:hypothetical protein
MIASCIVALFFNTIEGAWKFLIALSAGTGSVFILRWFWWRINAWSEVSAMASSFIVSLILKFYYRLDSDDPMQFAWTVIITVSCTTAAWVITTFMTRPEKMEVLLSFYRRVHPGAAFWGPIALKAPDIPKKADIAFNLLDWFCGCVLVYMALFGTGKLIFGQWLMGIIFLILAACAGLIIYLDLNRRGWKSVME